MAGIAWKIYKTTCLVNGKVYIGQTIKEGKALQWYFGSGSILKKAMNKYGRDKFAKEIIITCYTQKEANEYEALFIEMYSSTIYEIGYNILNIAYLDIKKKSDSQKLILPYDRSKKRKRTEEEKLRTSRLISLRNKGKVVSLETRIKMSIAAKGKIASLETRIKRSINSTGKRNSMYGRKQSTESIRKNSESQKGGKSHVAKKIGAYNKNGELVMIFNAIVEAKKWLGVGNINQCLSGKCPTAGGYYWKLSN